MRNISSTPKHSHKKNLLGDIFISFLTSQEPGTIFATGHHTFHCNEKAICFVGDSHDCSSLSTFINRDEALPLDMKLHIPEFFVRSTNAEVIVSLSEVEQEIISSHPGYQALNQVQKRELFWQALNHKYQDQVFVDEFNWDALDIYSITTIEFSDCISFLHQRMQTSPHLSKIITQLLAFYQNNKHKTLSKSKITPILEIFDVIFQCIISKFSD